MIGGYAEKRGFFSKLFKKKEKDISFLSEEKAPELSIDSLPEPMHKEKDDEWNSLPGQHEISSDLESQASEEMDPPEFLKGKSDSPPPGFEIMEDQDSSEIQEVFLRAKEEEAVDAVSESLEENSGELREPSPPIENVSVENIDTEPEAIPANESNEKKSSIAGNSKKAWKSQKKGKAAKKKQVAKKKGAEKNKSEEDKSKDASLNEISLNEIEKAEGKFEKVIEDIIKTPSKVGEESLGMFSKKVGSNQEFVLKSGRSLRTLRDLMESLESMDEETFQHHVTNDKNDFENWVRHAIEQDSLAEEIRSKKARHELLSILKNHEKRVREEIEKAKLASIAEVISSEKEKIEMEKIKAAGLENKYKARLKALEDDRAEFEKEKKSLSSGKEDLENTKKSIGADKEEIENQKAELEIQKEEIETQRAKLEEQAKKLEEKQSELDSRESQLQEEKEAFEAEIQSHEEKKETHFSEIESERQKVDERAKELEEKAESFEDQQRTFDEKLADIQMKEDKFLAKDSALKEKESDLEEKNSELEKKHAQLEERHAEIQETHEKLEAKHEELTSLTKELEDRHGEVSKRQTGLQSREDKLDKREKELDKIRQELDRKEDDLARMKDEADKRIAEIEDKRVSEEEAAAAYRKEKEELEKELEEVRNALQAEKASGITKKVKVEKKINIQKKDLDSYNFPAEDERTNPHVYMLLEESRSLIDRGLLDEAKAKYYELKETYEKSGFEGAEKASMYYAIREVYDDINLAMLN